MIFCKINFSNFIFLFLFIGCFCSEGKCKFFMMINVVDNLKMLCVFICVFEMVFLWFDIRMVVNK